MVFRGHRLCCCPGFDVPCFRALAGISDVIPLIHHIAISEVTWRAAGSKPCSRVCRLSASVQAPSTNSRPCFRLYKQKCLCVWKLVLLCSIFFLNLSAMGLGTRAALSPQKCGCRSSSFLASVSSLTQAVLVGGLQGFPHFLLGKCVVCTFHCSQNHQRQNTPAICSVLAALIWQ